MKTIKVESWVDLPDNFTGTVELPNGDKFWYKKKKLHREDGPAIEYNDGSKVWSKEGTYHRINGPAIEYSDGTKEWWIENILYETSKLQFLIQTSIFLGKKENGNHNLDWLRFLTDEGIKEFPIVPGMKQDKEFKPLFNQVFGAPTKP